ncbi:5-oxoprolinase subunit PxpB [Halobacillus salinarum]|uniref:5-oxoprolinase subunit PxpB n=1 Tax=Halobacillus salinarum TaxID=2932257 RepID=A0ABY4EHD8_9BACI|nr:5-oxoprolinase subunit PxpB [Halobacillus salinarum]UOQ43868.1 5-oxoprolinase subunit PxpB [Halobacillus salinarum]
MNLEYSPLGDQAVIIQIGHAINELTHKRVQQITLILENSQFDWFIEYVPAFTTVTVFYDPVKVSELSSDSSILPYDWVCKELSSLLTNLRDTESVQARTVEIPVCYEEEFAPDLEFVAQTNNLHPEEVIDIHSKGQYLVYMIGFAPGFPYIGGMDEQIAAPRRENPRERIPEGSVGIAGNQTGVYPIETPGGWQLIGRTPLELFRPQDTPPSLLNAGDRIKFIPISKADYEKYKEGEHD